MLDTEKYRYFFRIPTGNGHVAKHQTVLHKGEYFLQHYSYQKIFIIQERDIKKIV